MLIQVNSDVLSCVQLVDVTTVFQETQIDFVKDALLKPDGCIQAICVPEGMVSMKSRDSVSDALPPNQHHLQH